VITLTMAEPETDKRPEGEEPEAPARSEASGDDARAVDASPSAKGRAAPSSPPSEESRAEARGERVSVTEQAAVAAALPERPSSKERASARPSVKAPAAAGGPLGAYEAVARSARLPDLVAIAQKIVGEAATARRTGSWDFAAKVAAAADDAKLSRSDAETPFGNVLKVLGTGPEGEAERALAAALWAHAIAEARRDDEERLSGDVLWLATHTHFDATSLLDRALGEDADDLWAAIGQRIRRLDEGKGAALGRGEAIVGCAALAASDSTAAKKVAAELAPILKDKALSRLLESSARAAEAPGPELRLEGEALSPPRGPVVTALLALTGLLFILHAVRLFARLALAYRASAEVSLSEAGVRVKTRTSMLGRTLREREHVIVRAGLVRVVREVRYPRASFYAGLLALALGSYVGVRAFADGVRAASPSLLLTGLIVIAIGIAADFALGTLLPGARGRVRLAFVPRTGAVLCVGDVDAKRADDALARTLAPR
jgi:hypothetical protein